MRSVNDPKEASAALGKNFTFIVKIFCFGMLSDAILRSGEIT